MKPDTSRRDFIKTTVSLGVGLGLSSPTLMQAAPTDRARGLPTVIYGRTGERIPRIVLGLGSRFCAIKSPDESDKILNHALDSGLYFWDTAAQYEDKKTGVVSEERLGRVLATRRKEVFISTKVAEREPEAAKRQIEKSLKRLGISRLDQLMVHSITTPDDAEKVLKKGGVAEVLQKLKEEGVCRFIGFTGHTSAEALKLLAERGNFDSMLMALNHYGNGKEPRQQTALPAARNKGMGVLVMKAIRPREKDPSLKPAELIRYALSLSHPHAVVIGTDTMEVLDANLALLRHFQPLSEADMKRFASVWESLDQQHSLPWMQSGYRDGHWA